LIANRDPGGHAKGTFFFDQGWKPKTSDIKNHIYEHYEFLLTKNTLQKFDLNPGNSTGNQSLNRFVITNAEDLKDTDFACWTSVKDRNVTMLPPPTYSTNKTLEFVFAANESEHFNMTDL